MNTTKNLIAVLLLLSPLSICPSRGETTDRKAFIEALREHKESGTERDFSDELRETISQDKNGKLIQVISEDPELNSAIFYNLDAVPERFLELVLASWLEDDYQWGARGGMYYSPATQLDHWLRNRIRPTTIVDPQAGKNLYFVLEDKNTRIELAKVLRRCYSDKELSLEDRSERRAEAWNAIVGIVERSFPRLLEEDKKRRADAAKEPKPEPGHFLKELKQGNPEGGTMNQAGEQANIETDRWMWFLLAIAVLLGATGFLLRGRITRRRS